VINCDNTIVARQVVIVAAVLMLGAQVVFSQTEPATAPATMPSTAPAPDRYAKQLAAECDHLINVAVKRPYGWAWSESTEQFESTPSRGNRRAPVVVAMGKRESSAAGLVLLLAGQFLNEQRYIDASHEAARGAASALTKNGQVLRAPTFGPTAGGREPPAYVPPRDATVAALGLLLADLEASGDHPDPAVRRSVIRAATWLTRQQANNGGWPVGYPADAAGRDAARIQRLDNTDYRDSTWALFLTADVTGEKVYDRAARKACDLLLKMRLSRPPMSADLWSIAYTVEGNLTEPYLSFPDGADVISSRYALQTLLGAFYFTEDADYAAALEAAHRALVAARSEDGSWRRFPEPGAPRTPSTQPGKPGATSHPAVTQPMETGTYQLEPMLTTLAKLPTITREKYLEQLGDYYAPRQRVAAALCGLMEEPWALDLPASQEEAERFAQDETKPLGAPELEPTVKRLWALLLRAKIERRFGL
jgi:hypothetical protein